MKFPVEWLSKCWFLAGPTASGKTAVSLTLARQINAEVIALDSMTLYRGMNIGTAKPDSFERSCVPHHLIDVLNPEDEFSVADYVSAAADMCGQILERQKTPLFVGGSGLYLRGILRGIFEGPSANLELRRHLEQLADQMGAKSLLDRLREVDPITANRLHENDRRRVIRALEVYELTGQAMSACQQQGPRPAGERPENVYWLLPPRDWLYQRIDRRVEQMFAAGLVDEVRDLLARSMPFSTTARQALGYKEVIDWLNESVSRSDVADLVSLIQTRTRQFAKRQHTWFRNLQECRPIVIEGIESADQIAQKIIDAASSGERGKSLAK